MFERYYMNQIYNYKKASMKSKKLILKNRIKIILKSRLLYFPNIVNHNPHFFLDESILFYCY